MGEQVERVDDQIAVCGGYTFDDSPELESLSVQEVVDKTATRARQGEEAAVVGQGRDADNEAPRHEASTQTHHCGFVKVEIFGEGLHVLSTPVREREEGA
jgi:hypothetical protein